MVMPEEIAFHSESAESWYVWICSGLYTRSENDMMSSRQEAADGLWTSSSIVLSPWIVSGLSLIASPREERVSDRQRCHCLDHHNRARDYRGIMAAMHGYRGILR